MRLSTLRRATLCTASILPTATIAKELFGTINGLGQHSEHEKITRAALQCTDTWDGDCFEKVSMNQLAGKPGSFGAIGSPDFPPAFGAEAHCDDADFLNITGYPQTRAAATAKLQNCVTFMMNSFKDAVKDAVYLLDGSGQIKGTSYYSFAWPYPDCSFRPQRDGRAKCNVIQGLGVALHGVQDFYSHSNWADTAAPPYTIMNPPGLANIVPAPLLNLRPSAPPISVPLSLSTGCCHTFFDSAPAAIGKPCYNRILHDTMNKDNGFINPTNGSVSMAETTRGRYNNNFQRAVTVAVLDTKRQWADLKAELVATYGSTKARRMVCVITRDQPWKTCK